MMCYRARVLLPGRGAKVSAEVFVLADDLTSAVRLLSGFESVEKIEWTGVGISQTGVPSISIPYEDPTP